MIQQHLWLKLWVRLVKFIRKIDSSSFVSWNQFDIDLPNLIWLHNRQFHNLIKHIDYTFQGQKRVAEQTRLDRIPKWISILAINNNSAIELSMIKIIFNNLEPIVKFSLIPTYHITILIIIYMKFYIMITCIYL